MIKRIQNLFNKNKIILALTAIAITFLSLGGAGIRNVYAVENIATVDLFETVSATEEIGDSGLVIKSDSSYQTNIKGLFTDNVTIRFNFAEEPDSWIGGDLKIRFTDAKNSAEYFTVVYTVGSSWASGSVKQCFTCAYVQYKEYFRTSNVSEKQYFDNLEDAIKGSAYSNPTFRQSMNKAAIGELTFKKGGDGLWNVQTTKYNDASVRTIAKFDGKNQFVSGVSFGLPVLNFDNGYTISVSSEFSVNGVSDHGSDIVVESVTHGGETVSLKGESTAAPDFYEKYKDYPVIRTDNFESTVLRGEKFIVPTAVWTSVNSSEPKAVEKAEIKLPSGVIAACEMGEERVFNIVGEYELIYTQSGHEYHVHFSVVNMIKKEDYIITNAKKSVGENGLVLSSNESYAADFQGIFFGDFDMRFNFSEKADTNDTWVNGDLKVTFTDAKDASKYFSVIYSIANVWLVDGQRASWTYAHVEYGKNALYRSSSSHTNWTDRDPERPKDKEAFACSPAIRQAQAPTVPSRMGILKVKKASDGKWAVQVNGARNDEMRTIAKFDGTENFVNGKYWGLPDLSFENGYTVAVSSDFYEAGVNDKGSDILIDSVTVGNSIYNFKEDRPVSLDYAFSADMENAVLKGETFFIPQNVGLGKTFFSYTLSLQSGNWKIIEEYEWELSDISTQTVGKQIIQLVDDTHAEDWMKIDKQYTLQTETAYVLSFEVNGGKKLEDIVFSDNTLNSVKISDPERNFWEFEGWYTDKELTSPWSGNISSLAGKSAKLYAKWQDVTPPSVSLNSIDYETVSVGATRAISETDVTAGDAAQNDTVNITYEVKKPNGDYQIVSAGYELHFDESGEYLVRYTATDGAGLSASVEKTFYAAEAFPEITVKEGQTQAICGQKVLIKEVSAKYADGTLVAVDAFVHFGDSEVAVDENAFSADGAGVYIVTYTVKTGSGIIPVYEYQVTVIADEEAPTISVNMQDTTVCVGETVVIPKIDVKDNSGQSVAAAVSVNFGTESVNVKDSAFKAEKCGVYTVTIRAEDGSGNVSVKTVKITVIEAEKDEKGCKSQLQYQSVAMLLAVFAAGIFVNKIKLKKNRKED